MRFFKLTSAKPTSGLITIRPDDQIHIINQSSNIPLVVEFSTTNGDKEILPLIDEIEIQNNYAFLKRSYFRMEVMIQDPKKLTWEDEVYCKMQFL